MNKGASSQLKLDKDKTMTRFRDKLFNISLTILLAGAFATVRLLKATGPIRDKGKAGWEEWEWAAISRRI